MFVSGERGIIKHHFFPIKGSLLPRQEAQFFFFLSFSQIRNEIRGSICMSPLVFFEYAWLVEFPSDTFRELAQGSSPFRKKIHPSSLKTPGEHRLDRRNKVGRSPERELPWLPRQQQCNGFTRSLLLPSDSMPTSPANCPSLRSAIYRPRPAVRKKWQGDTQ